MKSGFKQSCYIILLIFAIGWVLYSFKEGKNLIETTKKVNIIYFIPQFIFIFFANILNSYLNVSLIQYFGLKLSWQEWIPLGFVNSLANLIFPAKTGTMIKAAYLKKKYDFAIAKNFSLLLFTTFMTCLNLFFLTGILLFFIRLFSDRINSIDDPTTSFFDLLIISMFILTIIIASVFLLLKLIKPYKSSFQGTVMIKIMHLAMSLLQGSIELNSDKIVPVKIFICTSLNYFIRLGMLYWGFLAVNSHLNISQLIFINLFFSLQSIVNFLPGNIGVQEVIITISSGMIGGDFSDGLIVAAIIRLTSLIEIFLFGSISYKLLNINTSLRQETSSPEQRVSSPQNTASNHE